MIYDAAILGGGLSGLAAAVRLAGRGASVALIDQAPRLGGRCYSYLDKTTGDVVDNGQHVILGAYRHLLEYLRTIGTLDCLKSEPHLVLPFYRQGQGITYFRLPTLPRPLDLTAGILKFKLLTLRDRRDLVRAGSAISRNNAGTYEQLQNLTVDQWLDELRQSENSRECFWNPLAIAIMNELPSRSSALLFSRSLNLAFSGSKGDSRILFPTVGQTELYVSGAEGILHASGSRILLNTRAEALSIANQKATGIRLADRSEIKARWVISTVPYYSLQKLLPPDMRSVPPFNVLRRFGSSPIISLHLWFDRDFMDLEFVGLIGKKMQWLFNRRRILHERGRPDGYLTAVISGAHGLVDRTPADLSDLALREVKSVFPQAKRASLVHAVVIKEKRATFSPVPEIEPLRPGPQTGIGHFVLAGDWTNTGLPATIEGAVKSGFLAADRVSGGG